MSLGRTIPGAIAGGLAPHEASRSLLQILCWALQLEIYLLQPTILHLPVRSYAPHRTAACDTFPQPRPHRPKRITKMQFHPPLRFLGLSRFPDSRSSPSEPPHFFPGQIVPPGLPVFINDSISVSKVVESPKNPGRCETAYNLEESCEEMSNTFLERRSY